jgi:hypothetical protein
MGIALALSQRENSFFFVSCVRREQGCIGGPIHSHSAAVVHLPEGQLGSCQVPDLQCPGPMVRALLAGFRLFSKFSRFLSSFNSCLASVLVVMTTGWRWWSLRPHGGPRTRTPKLGTSPMTPEARSLRQAVNPPLLLSLLHHPFFYSSFLLILPLMLLQPRSGSGPGGAVAIP